MLSSSINHTIDTQSYHSRKPTSHSYRHSVLAPASALFRKSIRKKCVYSYVAIKLYSPLNGALPLLPSRHRFFSFFRSLPPGLCEFSHTTQFFSRFFSVRMEKFIFGLGKCFDMKATTAAAIVSVLHVQSLIN
jgi:hypothetical protein